MSPPLPRPPRAASVEELQTRYFPELARALLAGVPPLPFTLEALLDIGGESFTVLLGPDGITTRPGATAAPLVRCFATGEDFRRGVRELLPPLLRRLDKLLPSLRDSLARAHARLGGVDPEKLRDEPGSVEVELTDDAGDVLRAVYHVGSGAGPRVLVRLTDAEVWSILEGHVRLTRLISTRLRLEGDVGYLLRLARALGAE